MEKVEILPTFWHYARSITCSTLINYYRLPWHTSSLQMLAEWNVSWKEIQNLTGFAQFSDFNILSLISTRLYYNLGYFPEIQKKDSTSAYARKLRETN